MSDELVLHPTACAYCETFGNAAEVFAANFDARAFNPVVFSARRLPDRLHYRMVRCNTCGLLRSDPVADAGLLHELYSRSDQTYDPEVRNLRETYGRYLGLLDQFGVSKGSLMEVGCGSGFFLEEAQLHGYAEVFGIEPSEAAVALAAPDIRPGIKLDVLRPGLYPDAMFDVICLFQVFDHLPDPNASLEACTKLLKPGGLLLALNHDAGSLSARALGESSPIIDIEHTYIYDRRQMASILEKHGYAVLRAGTALNRYSLQYLFQLVPMPRSLKMAVLHSVQHTGLGRIRMTVALGNQYLVARRPA
jgi:SAM-dependent methyltransferase